jgi:imidazolonepropionase-like amidohydrolase
MQAIQTATINSARLLQQEKNIGSISAGKSADLTAMACNPIEKIECTAQVQWVMKSGGIIKGNANHD